MQPTVLRTALAIPLAALLAAVPAAAEVRPAAFWQDSGGGMVHNGAGECWRTGYADPGDTAPGCPGYEPPAPAPVAEPEPTPAAPKLVTRTIENRQGTRAYFAFDSAELTLVARKELDALMAQVGPEDRIQSLRITAHADRIGPRLYNQRLSERRAQAVATYLREHHGVPAEVLETAALGEADPEVECTGNPPRQDLIECLAPNRRTRVVVTLSTTVTERVG
jgi:OOP family OmpA-OmpF porin